MEKWEIKRWWEEASPEEIKKIEETFQKPLAEIIKEEIAKQKSEKLGVIEEELKEEKGEKRARTMSVVTKTGLTIIGLGGAVATAGIIAKSPDKSVGYPLVTLAFGSTMASLIAPVLLDGTKLFSNDTILEDVQLGLEARKNIKELKELQKTLRKDLEEQNV